MGDTPARDVIHGVALVRHAARHAMLAGLVVVGAATGACGRAESPAGGTGDAASQVAEPESAGVPAGDPSGAGDSSGGGAPDGVAAAPESPGSPAPPVELSSPEHQRYQQLRLETLRSMIDAAKLALPIGPFQQRIDAAARIALEDVSEAGDLMEQIVADLREAIAASGQ